MNQLTITKPKTRRRLFLILAVSFGLLAFTGLACVVYLPGIKLPGNWQEAFLARLPGKSAPEVPVVSQALKLPAALAPSLSDDQVTELAPSDSRPKFELRLSDNNADPLAAYRHILLSVNLLVTNFLQEKACSHQIDLIARLQLPEDILTILTKLAEYNQQLLVGSQKTHILPLAKLLKPFITIEQESLSAKQHRLLRATIIENLDLFISFFYTQKLQQALIESSDG